MSLFHPWLPVAKQPFRAQEGEDRLCIHAAPWIVHLSCKQITVSQETVTPSEGSLHDKPASGKAIVFWLVGTSLQDGQQGPRTDTGSRNQRGGVELECILRLLLWVSQPEVLSDWLITVATAYWAAQSCMKPSSIFEEGSAGNTLP